MKYLASTASTAFEKARKETVSCLLSWHAAESCVKLKNKHTNTENFQTRTHYTMQVYHKCCI